MTFSELPGFFVAIAPVAASLMGMVLAIFWLREKLISRTRITPRGYRRPRSNPDESPPPWEKDTVGPEAGGYILLDIPEAQKPLFHDLLKGFEEYAGLRGYRIQFSVDGSLQNRIAFKFTIMDPGIGVSTSQVKRDLQDYIQKVQRGDPLDDLPVILPKPEHNALLLAMKNRISFLQHTYRSQKNVIDFYEKTMRQVTQYGIPVMPSQTFYIQAGGASVAENKFITRQAGAVGPNASALNFSQVWHESKDSVDLPTLADELKRLRTTLRAKASSPEHDVALGAVAAAESAARAGDGVKVLEYLQRAGKWALEAATNIGVRVAAEAIKRAAGMT